MNYLVCIGRTTYFSEPFVVVDSSIPDKLDLRNAGNRLKIRVKNRFLGVARLVVSMTVAIRLGIEGLRLSDI